MLNPTPKEEFFNRLGATVPMAEELAKEFDSVAQFLEAHFKEKISPIAGQRKAEKIAAHYQDFEHMRDVGTYRQIGSIEGIGLTTGSQISDAYLRSTVTTPRDVLSATDLARKMGLATQYPAQEQQTLTELNG
jgi:hypothetical protein